MNQENVIYIPKTAKIVFTVVAVAMFLISVSIVGYSLYFKIDQGIISTALSVAQTCAAGLSVVAVVFFTKFSVSMDELRRRTTTFLTSEMPQALSILDYETPEFQISGKHYVPSKMRSRVKVSIQHINGTHYANFLLNAYHGLHRIYVQVNVKRMVVSYFIPNNFEDEETIKSRLSFVVTAAKNAGYDYSFEHVFDAAEGGETFQLRLFRNLDDNFLLNPSERLYISNDFASMTRAYVRTVS